MSTTDASSTKHRARGAAEPDRSQVGTDRLLRRQSRCRQPADGAADRRRRAFGASTHRPVLPGFRIAAGRRVGAVPRAHRPRRSRKTSTAGSRRAVVGLPGVERVVSTASQGIGKVTVEMAPFADADTVFNDIQSAIDRIENFPPVRAEQPTWSFSRSHTKS